MKPIILIGKTEAGKTTLAQKLLEEEIQYQKTQSIENLVSFIDTPGEYLENRYYYNALIASAVESDLVGFVEDATAEQCYFPPGFATAFGKEAIGIITKTDVATPAQIAEAQERLLDAGATQVFCVSAMDGTGIEALKAFLM